MSDEGGVWKRGGGSYSRPWRGSRGRGGRGPRNRGRGRDREGAHPLSRAEDEDADGGCYMDELETQGRQRSSER